MDPLAVSGPKLWSHCHWIQTYQGYKKTSQGHFIKIFIKYSFIFSTLQNMYCLKYVQSNTHSATMSLELSVGIKCALKYLLEYFSS